MDSEGRPLRGPEPACNIAIEARVQCVTPFSGANVGVIVFDQQGYRLIDANTALRGEFLSLSRGQTATLRLMLRDVRLKPATYSLSLYLGRSNMEEIDHVESAAILYVLEPAEAKHSEAFPGVYQCDFSHELVVEA